MESITKEEVLIRAAKNHLAFVSIAFGYVRDWAAAEDIVQESYLTMGKKWKDYRPETSIIPWGRAIIRYDCLAYLRNNKRMSSFSNEYIEENMHSELEQLFDQSSSLEMENQIRVLSKCMNNLNERSKRLLYEFYVKGRRCRDIAQEDGEKEKTYSMHLWRLRSKLRKCMKNDTSAEEEASENEEIVDEFFISSDASTERICNLLQSEKGAGRPVFAPYIQEWCVFATAITRVFEEQENLDFNTINPRESRLEIAEETEKVGIFPVNAVMELSRESKIVARGNNTYIFSAIAACLILGIGLWYTMLRPQENYSLATIEKGAATILNKGGQSEISAQEGHIVLFGDSISVAAGQICVIKYLGEDSTLNIKGPGELVFSMPDARNLKKINFKRGEMLADIAKQASGRALEIETDTSLIKVIGTRFKLTANTMKTNLYLETGRLLIKEKSNGQETIMTSGQLAEITVTGINLTPYDDKNVSVDKEGLVSLYKFDEGSGRRFLDSSIYGLHGKMNKFLDPEVAWIPGPLGKALYFGRNIPGGSPLFQIHDFSTLPINDELSILFWLNCRAISLKRPTTQAIISCRDGNTSGFNVSIGGHKNWYDVRFSYKDNYLVTQTPLKYDEWNHVAITFNSGLLKHYINGSLDSSRQFDNDKIFIKKGKPLSVGPYIKPYEMALDNFSVYNRALRDMEIRSDKAAQVNF